MIVALRTPLLFLLTHGVSAGVLNEGMLKHALCKNLTGSKHLLGNWSLNDAVRDISKHFMYCIAMLRAVKREDGEAGDRRRYPKSGGFRRKLGMHEHDVVDQLTQAMIIDASGNVDEGESVGESHVVDEDPWPECFAMSCIADEKNDVGEVPADPADDAWPDFCTPVKGQPIEQINPCAAQRKRTAHADDDDDFEHEVAAPKKPKSKAKKSGGAPCADNPLYFRSVSKVFLTVTTEEVPRAQLTALVDGVRIHIATLRAKSHGKAFVKLAHDVQAAMMQHHMCRREAEVFLAKHAV